MNQFIALLAEHQTEFIQRYQAQLNPDIRHAMNAMLNCQTEQQPKTKWYCSYCHHIEQHPLSCGHRHCPQCQHQTTSQWLARQQQKLLIFVQREGLFHEDVFLGQQHLLDHRIVHLRRTCYGYRRNGRVRQNGSE